MFKAPGPLYVIAAGTLAAAAYVWWINSQAVSQDAGDGSETDAGASGGFFTGILDSMNSGFQNAFSDPASALANTNVQAFLRMVRVGEGTSGANGYTTLFGGGQFADMSKHPDVRVPFGSTYSTAAGAYQINYPTWLDIQAALSLPDFSAASQDIAACWLIKRAGALADVINGAVDSAISKCNKVWASLPGAPYGQPTRTLAQAENDFAAWGGVQTDAGASA